MNNVYRLLFALAALLSASCQTVRNVPSVPAEDRVEFILLQINDVYEIAPLDGGRVGGIARVAAIYNQLKVKNPNTVSMLSGDFIGPSLMSSLTETVDGERVRIAGAQMVDVLNHAGLDYATFGNHEFDIDAAALQHRMDEARFAFVSSNVKYRGDDTVTPFMQHGKPVPTYAVHTFATDNGASFRLGIIGVTLPFNQQDYVHYDDVFEAAQNAYEAARSESDLVVAVTHLAIEDDVRLAGALPGIPLIIGGHEHTDTLATVGSTRIAKADANARTIYIHWVTHDLATGATDVWSQLMPVTDDIAPDPATEEVVARWEARAERLIQEMGYEASGIVAQFPAPFDGRESTIRTRPTALGRLIACAMLDADSTAELAFLNSGSIRIDDQLQGRIEQRDILRTLPFGGALVHGQFRGDVLQRALRAGLVANLNEGGYFQTTANVHIQGNTFFVDGAPIDPEATYEAVLPEFLSLGLEANLDFLKTEATYRPLDLVRLDGRSGNDLRDVTIRYLKETDWINDCRLSADFP